MNRIGNDNRLCTFGNFFGNECGVLDFRAPSRAESDHLQEQQQHMFHTPWDNILMQDFEPPSQAEESDHSQQDVLFHTPWDNILMMHQTLNATTSSAPQPQGTRAKTRLMPFQQQLPKRQRREVFMFNVVHLNQ